MLLSAGFQRTVRCKKNKEGDTVKTGKTKHDTKAFIHGKGMYTSSGTQDIWEFNAGETNRDTWG